MLQHTFIWRKVHAEYTEARNVINQPHHISYITHKVILRKLHVEIYIEAWNYELYVTKARVWWK